MQGSGLSSMRRLWPLIRQDLVRHVDESWPTHSIPTAAYGREKAYLERYLDAYELRHPEIRVVRLRPCFIFKRSSASEQLRIFAGPLVPRALLRPGRLPIVPLPAGLRFQAMHGDDAAEAYRLALLSDARGAYNVATDPVIDGDALGKLLEARGVQVPKQAVSAVMAGAWRLRLIPSDESMLKMFLGLPTLDSSRIRAELGWEPRYSGTDALREVMEAMAEGAGGPTPPLNPPPRGSEAPRNNPGRPSQITRGWGESATSHLDEGGQRFRVLKGIPAYRLVGVDAREDALHRHLALLAVEGAWYLPDHDEPVGYVAWR